jgi:autophagy-related protein 9
VADHWVSVLQVHAEFSNLFALKITVFFTELLSVLLTPFILLFSLPPCAGAIIDFFREFTVHVDGIGYVCSFAVFDFTRHGNLGPTGAGAGANVATVGTVKSPSSPSMDVRQVDRGREQGGHGLGLHADRLRANENKMEKSFLHFKATHPDWQPDPSSSIFLDKLVGMHRDALAVPPPSGAGGGGLSGSYYAAGRGLGVGPAISSSGHMYGYGHTGAPGPGVGGYDENRLRERSRSYDRAWAKSSHLLRSPPDVTSGMRGREAAERERERKEREKRLGLETMREDDEEEAERMGWHARADGPGVSGGGAGGEEDEDEDAGYLRDVGVAADHEPVTRAGKAAR